MTRAASFTLIAAVLALAACTNPDGSANNQRTGAVLGGIGGAVLGNELDSNVGAAIGGIVGAGAGAQVGQRVDANRGYY